MESGGNFRRIVFHFFQLLRWKIEECTGLIGDYRCGGFPVQVQSQFSHHGT
jgi:hypothetical protein